ncbi:hypothetical protein YSY43_48990 [Paenibacillus sp. YSY-4.3]
MEELPQGRLFSLLTHAFQLCAYMQDSTKYKVVEGVEHEYERGTQHSGTRNRN